MKDPPGKRTSQAMDSVLGRNGGGGEEGTLDEFPLPRFVKPQLRTEFQTETMNWQFICPSSGIHYGAHVSYQSLLCVGTPRLCWHQGFLRKLSQARPPFCAFYCFVSIACDATTPSRPQPLSTLYWHAAILDFSTRIEMVGLLVWLSYYIIPWDAGMLPGTVIGIW